MNISLFWEITPCSPLKVNRHFGGTCRLHLQGLKVSQAINYHEAASKQAGVLCLHFSSENGGDMFFRKVG
jgi:hypothetical protein